LQFSVSACAKVGGPFRLFCGSIMVTCCRRKWSCEPKLKIFTACFFIILKRSVLVYDQDRSCATIHLRDQVYLFFFLFLTFPCRYFCTQDWLLQIKVLDQECVKLRAQLSQLESPLRPTMEGCLPGNTYGSVEGMSVAIRSRAPSPL